jgi:molybdopterin-guanine dinucleotide biosynthesis protein B
MRLVTIVGQKNSGKTTLLIALAREFKRQGRTVATIKHATHPAVFDTKGTDSQRHFDEGNAIKTLIAAPELRVLFERAPDDTDPVTLATKYLQGADIVLVEGFRRARLPKVEISRTAIGLPPYYDRKLPNASEWIAVVTDDPNFQANCRVLRFQDTMWLPVLASLTLEFGKDVTP